MPTVSICRSRLRIHETFERNKVKFKAELSKARNVEKYARIYEEISSSSPSLNFTQNTSLFTDSRVIKFPFEY